MESPTPEKMNDHDLLITMHEQLKGLRTDIQGLRDGTSATLSDHELRLRTLESFRWLVIGGLIVGQAIGDIIMYFILH